MAKVFNLTNLTTGTVIDRLTDYAMSMADGDVSRLLDVLPELGITSAGTVHAVAKRAGICFLANIPGESKGECALIANPNTVKQWHEAQKKIKPKRSR